MAASVLMLLPLSVVEYEVWTEIVGLGSPFFLSRRKPSQRAE